MGSNFKADMDSKKESKIFNPTKVVYKIALRVFQILIFVGAIYVIYIKVAENQEKINFTKAGDFFFSKKGLAILAIVFLLQFFNWSLEALKFKKIISKIEKIDILTSIKSVYAGNAIGVLTPNKVGTFIGRALFLKNTSTVSIVSATLLGNLAQLVTTTLFGIIGFLIVISTETHLQFVNDDFPFVALLISVILFSLFYLLFFFPSFLFKFSSIVPFIKRYSAKIEYFSSFSKYELLLVLVYAILRYIVFAAQFYLLFLIFNIDINMSSAIAFIGVLYLIVTFIPSPFMGNLFTREAVVVMLLANYNSTTEVLVASFLLWLINIAFPAVLGSLIFLFNRNIIVIEKT